MRFHLAIHCVLSVLYFQNFENVKNLLNLTVDKLCDKFRNEVQILNLTEN